MKNKKLLFVSLLSIFALVGCSNNPTEDPNGEKPQETTEKEIFQDEVIQTNVDNLLKGFSMEGTVVQKRYNFSPYLNVDENGMYVVKGDPLETNTYYTNVAFNSTTENAFYKYSYREIETEDGQTLTLPAEGPYTYFEDESGYAYEEVIDYSNKVKKDFDSSISNSINGLTFGDNGFYNFATLFVDGDFTLDEDFLAYTRYDLDVGKAAIISNNLLYSLNSGAYALPSEAYVRVDNDVFTSLNIELSPIYSYDSYANVSYLITNSITFNFSHLGEETITHITPYEETEDSKALSSAFAKFKDQSYKLRTTKANNSLNPATGETIKTSEARDFYFTGKEVYVHDVVPGETANLDKTKDYYLAPSDETNLFLYPYGYNAETSAFEIKTNGYYLEDKTVRFPLSYCGVHLYNDILPIIADVSGTFFEFDADENCYVSKPEYVSSLNDCFLVDERPYADNAYDSIVEYRVYVDDSNSVTKIEAEYMYTDELDLTQNDGTITLEFSDVGSVTLNKLIA